MHAEWGEVAPRPPPRSTPRAPRAGASSRSAPPACACWKARRARTARSAPSPARPTSSSRPGYRFRAVDLLLTNFHLPRSTLFMLVCAFAGAGARCTRPMPTRSRSGYRFYSYGDACLLGARADERLPLRPSRRPTARRARGAHRTRRTARSTRRPSCRSAPPARSRRCCRRAVRETGAEIVLGNTYHLMLRPGAERVARLGGLHKFMDWPRPILTDSGGFQVMSLAELRKITEEGVTFHSHIDGTQHRADAGALDRDPAPAGHRHHDGARRVHAVAGRAARRSTSRWQLSMRWARALARPRSATRAGLRACSASCRAASIPTCAPRSAAALTEIGFDGYAVGGLAVGEAQATMFEMLDATVPHLPADRPRYLMGVGKPDDIVGAVLRGIDMFDCVLPTRAGPQRPGLHPRAARSTCSNARHRRRSAAARRSTAPARPAASYTRAYLHHLVKPRRSSAPCC